MNDMPRFWLTAFWGFAPEHEGYYGFTLEGGRTRFLDEYEEGDLIIVYGADSTNTKKGDRKQLLGILEIEPVPIWDTDKISDEGLKEKKRLGKEDSWRFAVPVRKAWQIDQRIGVADLLPDTYTGDNGQSLASFGQIITEREVEAITSLRVTPVNVFGEDSISSQPKSKKATFREAWDVSRGPKPAFGERLSSHVDGEAFVYIMEMSGPLQDFLGLQKYEILKKRLIKVGRTNNLERRLKELNAGFPPSAAFKWKLRVQSQPYSDGDSAHTAEQDLHTLFASVGVAQGGEYFLCEERAIDSSFAKIAKAFMLIAP